MLSKHKTAKLLSIPSPVTVVQWLRRRTKSAHCSQVLGSNPAGRKTPQPTCTLCMARKGGTSVPKAVGHCVRMRAQACQMRGTSLGAKTTGQ